MSLCGKGIISLGVGWEDIGKSQGLGFLKSMRSQDKVLGRNDGVEGLVVG